MRAMDFIAAGDLLTDMYFEINDVMKTISGLVDWKEAHLRMAAEIMNDNGFHTVAVKFCSANNDNHGTPCQRDKALVLGKPVHSLKMSTSCSAQSWETNGEEFVLKFPHHTSF